MIHVHVALVRNTNNAVVNNCFIKLKIIDGGNKMSSRVYIQDTTTLALLYNYEATRGMLLAVDKIRKFDHIVDNNLEEMNSNVNMVYPLDYSKLIYFTSFDEKGNEYCILKPDFDEEEARIKYIYRAPYDIIKASKKGNALDVLGLRLEDNKIIKKEKNKVKSMNLNSKYSV